MLGNKPSVALRASLAICALTLWASTCAATERQLYSFGNYSGDAAYPYAALVLDAKGNLYGTTLYGGADNGGTVFDLTKTGGQWTEKILHSFGSGGDGAYPYASLIFDACGNLYGTTYEGGTNASGTVFELTPKAGGGWTEKLLYSFGSYSGDGISPYAGLTLDPRVIFTARPTWAELTTPARYSN